MIDKSSCSNAVSNLLFFFSDMALKYYIVISVFSLFIYSAECHECYACHSTCLTSKNDDLQEKINEVQPKGGSCQPSCATPNNSTPTAKCTDSWKSCYSALGLLSGIDSDGNKMLTTYIKRDCFPSCPKNKICDLKKLKSCGYSPNIFRNIQSELARESKKINDIFRRDFGIAVDLGSGGELICCEGDKCNTDTETNVAHTYLKEEL